MNYFWPPVIKAEDSPVRHSMVRLIRLSPCAVMKLLHMAVHDCLLTRLGYRQVLKKKVIIIFKFLKANVYMLKFQTSAIVNISLVQKNLVLHSTGDIDHAIGNPQV